MPPKPRPIPTPTSAPVPLPRPSHTHNLTHYYIGKGEQLVLTYEPYKSFVLPHWRFRNEEVARKSAGEIYELFLRFYGSSEEEEKEEEEGEGHKTRRGEQGDGVNGVNSGYEQVEGDFVGMDMCRKFLQMGMTRAKRYANYKSGKKYDYSTSSNDRIQKQKGLYHEGKEEKEKASQVFREAWEKAKSHEGYLRLKEDWKREKKEWEELSEVEKEKRRRGDSMGGGAISYGGGGDREEKGKEESGGLVKEEVEEKEEVRLVKGEDMKVEKRGKRKPISKEIDTYLPLRRSKRVKIEE